MGSFVLGVISSILTVVLIYVLRVTNFLYLNDYVKIKSFLNSYHEYYILRLNQDNNLSCSGTSKVFDEKEYESYEFILMIKDYELYNSLNKFDLITKDDVKITSKNSRELEFRKSEETGINGNDIILINTDNPIFTRINTKVNVEKENSMEEEYNIQGITLHHLPYQHVQKINLQELLKFNLLTCVKKSLPTILLVVILSILGSL